MGFSEGDGSWQVDSRRSIFIINQKDPQILYKIKSFIGFGQINGPYKNRNTSTYYRYRVGNIKGTERLIEIFNGNLVLTKTEKRFKGYLDMYNSRVSKDKEIKIIVVAISHIGFLLVGLLPNSLLGIHACFVYIW